MQLMKVNDLSESLLKNRFLTQIFIPETNLAVCMGRVSTKDQKDEGRSDEAQIERIEEYAEKERLRIVKAWDVAETASKHEKRKHFIAMLDFIRKSHSSGVPIKHVIFSHQSRSNRNRKSARELEDLIREHEVTLHCVRDSLRLNCKSPQESWLMWDIFNNYNENFIKEHTKNVMDGTLKRVEMGLFPGKAPIGYKNVKKDNLNVFEIDPILAPQVIKMFESYSTGTYSIEMLHNELKNLKKMHPHIRTPSRAYVHMMLKNPFFIGEFYYSNTLFKGHPVYHPKLIFYELWKKVQDVLAGKGTFKSKWSSEKFTYSGLIKCGGHILDSDNNATGKRCGAVICAEVKRKMTKKGSYSYHYYYSCCNNRLKDRCSNRNKEFLKSVGSSRYITLEKLENKLADIFRPFEYSSKEQTQILAMYKKFEDDLIQKKQSELLKLQEQKAEVKKRISKSYEDKITGVVSENLWRGNYRKWQEEESIINAQIKSFGPEAISTYEKLEKCIELAKTLYCKWFRAFSDEKRKLVEILASNLILNHGSIEYHWRKPWILLPKKGEIEKWSA